MVLLLPSDAGSFANLGTGDSRGVYLGPWVPPEAKTNPDFVYEVSARKGIDRETEVATNAKRKRISIMDRQSRRTRSHHRALVAGGRTQRVHTIHTCNGSDRATYTHSAINHSVTTTS